MKIALTLSLILNLVLAYFLFTKKEEQRPPLEKIIIETHKEQATTKIQNPEVLEAAKSKPEVKADKSTDKTEDFSHSQEYGDFVDMSERMEREREEFLTLKLGLPEEKLQAHQKLREEYYKDSSQFFPKNPTDELSIEMRRKALDREEKFHKDLEKLYGSENWKRYLKFREEFNQRTNKEQSRQGRPLLFMEL